MSVIRNSGVSAVEGIWIYIYWSLWKTIRTFRIVRYIAGVRHWGMSVMQGSTALSVIAWSRCSAYVHNSCSFTPSRVLESTILARYGVWVSQCLILNQMIKWQLYKWDFPVPVGGHGSSTSSPATFELITLIWTLRTLFWMNAMRYCRNHTHFTIFLFSACNKGWARVYWLQSQWGLYLHHAL